MQNTQQFHFSWSFSCSPRESSPQRSGSLDCSRRNIKPTCPHFHPSGVVFPTSKHFGVVLAAFCPPFHSAPEFICGECRIGRASYMILKIERTCRLMVAIRCKSDFEDTIKLTMLKPPSATKRTPVI